MGLDGLKQSVSGSSSTLSKAFRRQGLVEAFRSLGVCPGRDSFTLELHAKLLVLVVRGSSIEGKVLVSSIWLSFSFSPPQETWVSHMRAHWKGDFLVVHTSLSGKSKKGELPLAPCFPAELCLSGQTTPKIITVACHSEYYYLNSWWI